MREIRKVRDVFIAFDIDGTIYDSAGIVVDAFRGGMLRYFDSAGEKPAAFPERDSILKLVGLPTHEIFIRLFPELSADELLELNDECSRSFVSIIRAGGGRLFPGVADSLVELHKAGYQFLTASNGREDYIKAILETHGLIGMFSEGMLFVSGEYPDKKDIVAEYMRGPVSGKKLIMVGDRASDRNAASANGVPFIGCSFGHAGVIEIQGEPYIADTFSDVPKLIDAIIHGPI